MMNTDSLISQVKDSASKLGIKKFDVFGATVESSSAQVNQGVPKQVKASHRSSIMVRVWNGDRSLGVTSTNDTTPKGLELALQTASEASNFGAKEHIPDFSPLATSPIQEMGDRTAEAAPMDTLLETLLEAEQKLLNSHPAIVGVPYNGLSQRDLVRFYVNSEGALRQEHLSYASIYLYSKTEEDGKKPRSAGAYRLGRSLEQLDIEGCLQETTAKTISHLNYEKMTSGRYLVMFSPEAFLSMLAAFSNIFNAQSVLDRQSLSTVESIGTAIASPMLSVSDYELHHKNIAATTFDSEGTPTGEVPLIKEGVLTNFLHSSITARRLNAQPTGNGNMGAKVSVSPNFFCVAPGSAENGGSYNIDTADNVIWIDELHALHSGVQSLQGSFSLPFDGWMIKGGDRISIESATVAGDIKQLLKSIVCVESEVKLTDGGVSPRVWVEGLSITGEG
ncbi:MULTISPECIES: TldD/PmbA family protein [Arthrospira]|jgi:PmbA protein|nr:TldD/PmbA family protein [Arthrospira platensis]AMW31254.1 peptidase C69 [Arthrospira platensis YZ]KDR58937.1 peptidase C69 [Arthrospira platensis str. Paraca]MBD2667955.1 TldD/PmbA family protein [Arthrospira platensis FACHB-439]MBD2708907.1 TldD/PmbA family protein [Arthrospira platensis FACHB-835]MDF2208695.1 TldD/PmbA family protein [Arthrospira platensis NCB002]MDT9181368.1 TldD/PmbA family protein [Limnospira sp. PMC 289.06]MDT9293737.1 TldD/PmbA family protein [Arthrospira platensi